MKIIKASDPTPTPYPATALDWPKINTKEVSAKKIICPAVMLAVKRIINTKGFIKIPIISIGTNINLMGSGTPCGHKICVQ